MLHCTAQANIIYVHLGSSLPSYIYIALEQARLFNPDADLYLIANQQAIDQSEYNFAKLCLKIVLCENLRMSSYHSKFMQKSTLNNDFREGFWRKASERFFYLHECIVLNDLKNVVHLESDNLIYVTISEILYGLEHYNGIGAVFDCDERCIPSFVYIKNGAAIEDLVSFMAHHAQAGHTDMEILALYKKLNASDRIDALPLIMPSYLNNYPLRNALKQVPKNEALYSNYFNDFNSIFDGAALGQYLGGIDPRNGPSSPGFINETCIFNPSHLAFEWIKDEQGRKIPYACFNNIRYRINNLHIHSKRLQDFIS